jgi:hypothetical protein
MAYTFRIIRDRFVPNVPVPVIALLAVFLIALLAAGIGYVLYR